MRIVLVATRLPPDEPKDGILSLYHHLSRSLLAAGHEVLVVCFTAGEGGLEKVDQRLSILRLASPYGQYELFSKLRERSYVSAAFGLEITYRLFLESRSLIREFKPDVVECIDHCGMASPWLWSGEYPVVIRACGPFHYFAEQGLVRGYSEPDVAMVRALELGALHSAHGLIAISGALASVLSAHCGVEDARIDVVRIPIDEYRQPSPTSSGAEVGGESVFSRGHPQIFYWGRIERQKGCDVLVDAFARIAGDLPEARLALAGRDSGLDGGGTSYCEQLLERLDESGLRHRVEFLGFLEDDAIRERASTSDLCVFPSTYETAGYTLIEAAQCKACIVASNVGAIPEYVSHGESGWLFDCGDSASLAAAILKLSGDEALRRRLADTASSRVAEMCGYEVVSAQSVAAYRKAIDRFASTPFEFDLQKHFMLSIIEHAIEVGAAPAIAFDRGLNEGTERGWREAGSKCFDEGFQDGYRSGFADALGQTSVRHALRNFWKRRFGGG